MEYLLQTVDGHITDPDILTVANALNKRCIDYTLSDTPMTGCLPIGDLSFVQDCIKIPMPPIGIPEALLVPYFTKRRVEKIKGRSMPSAGLYHIKDISHTKGFSYTGDILWFYQNFHQDYHPDLMYEISDIIDIQSEYRVFVYNKEILDIRRYSGDYAVFPNIELIKQAVTLYNIQPTAPKAYTLDFGVGGKNDETFILEAHPFCAVGLYGFTSPYLPEMYKAGINWYLQSSNKELIESSTPSSRTPRINSGA